MSKRYRPAIRQLVHNTKEQKTDVSFQLESFNSDSRFDDIVNYREEVTCFTFGISDIYRKEKTVRFFSMSVQTGCAGVGSNPIWDDFTYSDYSLLQGGLTKVWYPDENWTYLAKFNGQYGFHRLSQSRVFQIGGMATVRGTPEGLMTGDSGYVASFEARRRLTEGHHKVGVEAFGFFDHGGVFNRVYPVDDHPSDFLFSIGTGFNINWSRYVTSTIGYGQPLFTAESHREQYREKLRHGNAYFTVRAQF